MQVVRSPEVVESMRRLRAVLSTDLPDCAATLLVHGWDSPSLRELAGHPRDDPWRVDELWGLALAELGVDLVPSRAVWLGVAAGYELQLWRAGVQETYETMHRLLELTDWQPPAELPELQRLIDLGDKPSERQGSHLIYVEVQATLVALEQRLNRRVG
ncbi:hypothetical protein FNH05_25725 [Amycolatopsis rhizosphaerae]|uniref:Uncharacterized protein n=1 Tax=Amycolatopsis rhizosphaerae TaxID=2053003 RepID=A0A558BIQ6_9PSEU|nr:hypothetical protein [Amycolatopsis rhizosphaerae]TVT36403.1 hypothetical protein FNH05_25725 [Amycolatopsis rhizosphaerae]